MVMDDNVAEQTVGISVSPDEHLARITAWAEGEGSQVARVWYQFKMQSALPADLRDRGPRNPDLAGD